MVGLVLSFHDHNYLDARTVQCAQSVSSKIVWLRSGHHKLNAHLTPGVPLRPSLTLRAKFHCCIRYSISNLSNPSLRIPLLHQVFDLQLVESIIEHRIHLLSCPPKCCKQKGIFCQHRVNHSSAQATSSRKIPSDPEIDPAVYPVGSSNLPKSFPIQIPNPDPQSRSHFIRFFDCFFFHIFLAKLRHIAVQVRQIQVGDPFLQSFAGGLI